LRIMSRIFAAVNMASSAALISIITACILLFPQRALKKFRPLT
jgi:hypothetical protein